jgi:hypothetical protein
MLWMRRRTVPEVVVLGSGPSILELTPEDVAYINRCQWVIAVNKFMAFYKMTGIRPTHCYYLDQGEPCVMRFLQHVFDVCRADHLHGITFIMHKDYEHRIHSFRRSYNKAKREFNAQTKLDSVFLVPHLCHFQFLDRQNDWLKGDTWATSPDQPLFHCRGSLTSVLNYVGLCFPGRTVKLVGNDFNSSRYFFQDELEKLPFEWRDWTYPITQAAGRHFSAIDYKGTTMFDRFGYIMECLAKSNNRLVSCNPRSLLVEKGFVPYEPVRPQAAPVPAPHSGPAASHVAARAG